LPFVLNAFRHHGNSHLVRFGGLFVRILCSTPFGIMGILTAVMAL